MNARILLLAAASAIAATNLAGCNAATAVGPGGEALIRSNDASPLYGESVFRLQNGVLDDLIGLVDFPNGTSRLDAPALYAAEQRIVVTCRYLNEAAGIIAGGRDPGLPLKLKVLNSLGRCEASARAVKAELDTNAITLTSSSQ